MITYDDLLKFILDLTDGYYTHWADFQAVTGLPEARCREMWETLYILRGGK